MRNGERRHRGGGFTYVGLVILVAIIGLVAATTVRVGVTLQRAQAERDLLHIGEQFSDALKSYAAATPAGQPRLPPTLKELLKDPRFPGTRRHLRKVFVDPMTGKAEWGILYLADNRGILGIHSLSAAPAIKIANFPARFQGFSGKQKISEWVFTFDGQEPLPPGQVKPGQPGQPTPGQQGQPASGQPGQPAFGQPGQPAFGQPGQPTPRPGSVAPAGPGVPTPPKALEPGTAPEPVAEPPAEPAAPPESPSEPAEPAEPEPVEPAEPSEPAEPGEPAESAGSSA
ncbi:type II secretion system protein [Pseudoduganella sp. SL102]|uniref:type II secretion system protein n=1 Tax=Pseudoduganella sp. SL102 TaxID=2995154 RepID=UPI00248C6FE1|nr:type II secretion system protein [Pseudoduganella sp. SL102]WBS04504.1 type II secretion system protein [Pseudoduganella sp. SL102]